MENQKNQKSKMSKDDKLIFWGIGTFTIIILLVIVCGDFSGSTNEIRESVSQTSEIFGLKKEPGNYLIYCKTCGRYTYYFIQTQSGNYRLYKMSYKVVTQNKGNYIKGWYYTDPKLHFKKAHLHSPCHRCGKELKVTEYNVRNMSERKRTDVSAVKGKI